MTGRFAILAYDGARKAELCALTYGYRLLTPGLLINMEDINMSVKADLEITMVIDDTNRPEAAKIYSDYRQPFLDQIKGAVSKALLVRDGDIQVLHEFDSVENAKAYLDSELFKNDVFIGLEPL